MSIPELAALIGYFLLVLGIGIHFFWKDRKSGSEKDYFLGGRRMNGWVSALSAGASDMSAWVLMGLAAAVVISLIDRRPAPEVTAFFERSRLPQE